MTRKASHDDGSADSRRRIEEARHQAAVAGKRVAVVFGADWCPDHQALERSLQSQYVAPFVDGDFEVVVVDVGQRDRNLELMGEYGMAVERGIPAVAVLEPDGTVVTAQKDGEFLRPVRRSSAQTVSGRARSGATPGNRVSGRDPVRLGGFLARTAYP